MGRRSPAARVQEAPALMSGVQAQPEVEEPVTKVVLAGTVSAREAARAVALPRLVRVRP